MSSEQASSAGVRNAQQILELTTAEAREAGREDLIARLEDARRLLEDSDVRVHVVGGPRQGKSALIEALSVSARDMSVERSPAAPRLDLVEPGHTPGGTGPIARPARPIGPAQAHAVLFVSDASSALTDAELGQLRRIVDLCPTVMLVLTKIDSCPAWRSVVEQDQALLRDAGIGVNTWAVSPMGWLRAEWSGDGNPTDSSGISMLRAELETLRTDFERTSLRAVAHHTLAVLAELRQMLQQRRSVLGRPGVLAQARARAQAVDARATALRDRAVHWPAMLANGFATMHANTDFDLRRRTQAVRAEVENAISERNPALEWEVVSEWLHQRLAHEARENMMFAAGESHAFSERAAEHFGLTRPHAPDLSRVGMPTDPPNPPAATQALPADPVITLGTAMNVLMRGWIGFIMFFMLNSVTGLGLAPVYGVVAVVLMAATAVAEEWKQRLSRRRAQATAALHGYIDDATIKASNDVSELLRQFEQQLREAYGAHIDREEESLNTAESEAKVAVEEAERAPALVEEIDAGLVYYEELGLRASAMVAAQLLVDVEPESANGGA